MDYNYLPAWLTGQQGASIGDPNSYWTPFAGAPSINGTAPSLFQNVQDAGIGNPNSDWSNVTGVGANVGLGGAGGSVPQGAFAALMSNPSLWAGLAGLGKQQQPPEPPRMQAPDPVNSNGRPYMSQFSPVPFYTVQRGYDDSKTRSALKDLFAGYSA